MLFDLGGEVSREDDEVVEAGGGEELQLLVKQGPGIEGEKRLGDVGVSEPLGLAASGDDDLRLVDLVLQAAELVRALGHEGARCEEMIIVFTRVAAAARTVGEVAPSSSVPASASGPR